MSNTTFATLIAQTVNPNRAQARKMRQVANVIRKAEKTMTVREVRAAICGMAADFGITEAEMNAIVRACKAR